MKLLIASDIHGSAYYCRALLALMEQERPDGLVLLGDVLYHGPRNDLPRDYAPKEVIRLLSAPSDRILAVRGNCDADVDLMVLPFACDLRLRRIAVDGRTFHLTHGDIWNPEVPPAMRPGDVLLFGHTHVKCDISANGVRCLNPGSVSIPKDGSHSCLLYADGTFTFRLFQDGAWR